jgi:NDP-sugar pyrophosphorylase family protein
VTPGPAETDVVVLCGGLGTRLQGVLGATPKPMAPIAGKPFLEILVDAAARRGFRRFILCVGHGADEIERHFRDGEGRTFLFSREPSALGTAGALKLGEPLLRAGVALVMNGDSFCDLDLGALIEFHARRGGRGALAVAKSEGRTDGGSIEFGSDQRITAFHEKTPGVSAYINAGVYALSRAAVAGIPGGRPCSLEREVFPALLDAGLYAYPVEAPLYDIGTPERLERFRSGYPRG